MNSSVRAVIFDVDGTLYDYRTHSVPLSAQEALGRLRERGLRIIVASGRSYALLGESLVQLLHDKDRVPAGNVIADTGVFAPQPAGRPGNVPVAL